MAFITNGFSSHASQYQEVIDDGFIEISSHSQTHPSAKPYEEKLVSEISGNKQDLIDYFHMPELFRKSGKEYVYTWVAPNGYRDDTIDSLLAEEHYLINRLYNGSYNAIADWNNDLQFFAPFGMTGEMGNTSWSSTATSDTIELQNRFDNAYEIGGVYHFMMHPQSIDWNERYGHQHLEYISGKEDVWYVALGHLYLYELMANVDYQTTDIDYTNNNVPTEVSLSQNYPNPFNPTTSIKYSINKATNIKLEIYNINGQLNETLVNKNQNIGVYNIAWNASNYSSGIYYYRLSSPEFNISKKCLLVK